MVETVLRKIIILHFNMIHHPLYKLNRIYFVLKYKKPNIRVY